MSVFGLDLWVPASAHAPGSKQTLWKSDFYILNLSAQHCSLSMRYIASGLDQSDANLARPAVPVILPPEGQVHLLDVLATYFSVSSGSGGILLSGDCDFRFSSRTFTPAPEGAPGTYGQYIPAYMTGDIVSPTYLIGAVSSGEFRTNLGLMNTSQSESSTCVLTFRDKSGLSLASVPVELGPFVHVQYNDLFTQFNLSPQDNMTIDMACSPVSVLGYLSTVDNSTGDPVFLGGVR